MYVSITYFTIVNHSPIFYVFIYIFFVFHFQVWNHYKSQTVEKIADKGIYQDSLKEEILSVLQIGLQCTQSSPADRPIMSKVVELIRSRSHDTEIVLKDPPFLKVIDMFDHNLEGGENSRLISTHSTSGFSSSGWSRLTGR